MSKIINSLSHALAQLIFCGVALVKSMNHNVWKYKPRHTNPSFSIMVHTSIGCDSTILQELCYRKLTQPQYIENGW